jgi:hypothetical protein
MPQFSYERGSEGLAPREPEERLGRIGQSVRAIFPVAELSGPNPASDDVRRLGRFWRLRAGSAL